MTDDRASKGDTAADAFWQFSLQTYAAPGVAPACLAFQDEGGGDVNLLLFSLWCGRAAGILAAADIEAALALSARWRARVVAPLRALRRDLKAGVDGFESELLRDRIKAVELAAEEAQQRRIALLALAAAPPPGEPSARAMLDRYLTALSADLSPETAVAAQRHGEQVANLSASMTVPLLEF